MNLLMLSKANLLEKMPIDEYARYEKGNTNIQKVNQIWWREVRPFFFRPLFPFMTILPETAKPPFKSILGGFQHLVPSGDRANSFINFLIFDDVQNYSAGKLTHDYRKNIRKGLKSFSIQPIESVEEFIREGHRVYRSFYQRTAYEWRKERNDRRRFEQWARNLFGFRKILILGAYRDHELSAVSIVYHVEDIIIYSTFFSTTESLKSRISELMLHTIREMAAGCTDVRCIYMGPPNTRQSLNDFKISRGCKILSEPALYRFNPLVLFLSKQFRKDEYKKLIGKIEYPTIEHHQENTLYS